MEPDAVGQNAGLIDEMYKQYLTDPSSVGESWQDFFSDYKTETPVAESTKPRPKPPPAPAPAAAEEAATAEPPGTPIRGAAARVVQNMEASLAIPTATSYREVPAKLLEVNRSIINGYLGRTRGGKVSFTHLIGYAVVRAVADHTPVMNSGFVDDASGPRVIRHDHVGLGIAVDVQKADGSRNLLVPCIKDADTLSFREFVEEYEELIRKVRANRLEPDDFAGTTLSLTNPGMIGTERSVPRLMPGQGLIVGVGTIDYPTEFQAADPRTLAELGVSKVITLSSTYDHRIIQGAESGVFLQKVHQLLLGEHEFYVDAFRSMGVPYESVKWRHDVMPVDHESAMMEKQVQVNTVINMHRVRGHLIADLDPLGLKEPSLHPELDPATYGLTIWDLDRQFLPTGLTGIESVGAEPMPLGEILHLMRDAYARTVGIEYMHIQNHAEKQWIQERVEGVETTLDLDEKLFILDRLNAAEALERFLGTKYVGQKRFGLEGAESLIPILDTVVGDAADLGHREVVVGMSHRGRLNVLVNVVGKSYEKLFSEFEDQLDEQSIQGSGDVKYHVGQAGKFVSRAGNEIGIELAANPSHLEAVNPVVEGMVRAKLDELGPIEEDYPVLPVLLHGDAAFAGQGVVSETLNLSLIDGYRTGGTIHVVINNQVGFTTAPESARSSEYPTDVAKTVQAPIFHVNGDDPEACVRIAHLAVQYREQFNKDVVIDMWCYRRHGHNEGDDPSYTQPLMYKRIDEKRSVRKHYVEKLVKRGDLTLDDAERAMDDFHDKLQTALEATRDSAPPAVPVVMTSAAVGVLPAADTAVSQEVLDRVYTALGTVPEGLQLHPKLAQQFGRRDTMFSDGTVDWALAEALAFGSLLCEGTSIRLAGQDSRRGTFSQRHSTLVGYNTGSTHQPLDELCEAGTRLWIYDSLLSEYAALGFEYGYSVANKDALVIWEAQFGDFMNGAQIIIDQFLVSAEDKWGQTSGLVMLLPHGYEGQGPEHSSGRIERFLMSAAEDNIQVVNASKAAQYFHVLRRQMHRSVRKPLVLFTPKSLLRAKAAHSPLSDLTAGTFHEVLDDPRVEDPSAITRVIFASGKVSHDALEERDRLGAPVAVVRIEQLYPWPFDGVTEVLARYPNATELVWLQEEPENMGAWNFVKGRFYEAHGDEYEVRRVSRAESGAPAAGSATVHKQQQQLLLERAFATELGPREPGSRRPPAAD